MTHAMLHVLELHTVSMRLTLNHMRWFLFNASFFSIAAIRFVLNDVNNMRVEERQQLLHVSVIPPPGLAHHLSVAGGRRRSR